MPAPLHHSLIRALYKKLAAIFRNFGTLAEHPQWQARAEICARCPIAVLHNKDLFCGKPYLKQLQRTPQEGCGCPVLDKAKDPSEHCPVDPSLLTPTPPPTCTCKWCQAGLGPPKNTPN